MEEQEVTITLQLSALVSYRTDEELEQKTERIREVLEDYLAIASAVSDAIKTALRRFTTVQVNEELDSLEVE